jgi:hypothetical protein
MSEISNQFFLAYLIAKAHIIFASITTECACQKSKKSGYKKTILRKLYRYFSADLQNLLASLFLHNNNFFKLFPNGMTKSIQITSNSCIYLSKIIFKRKNWQCFPFRSTYGYSKALFW